MLFFAALILRHHCILRKDTAFFMAYKNTCGQVVMLAFGMCISGVLTMMTLLLSLLLHQNA